MPMLVVSLGACLTPVSRPWSKPGQMTPDRAAIPFQSTRLWLLHS